MIRTSRWPSCFAWRSPPSRAPPARCRRSVETGRSSRASRPCPPAAVPAAPPAGLVRAARAARADVHGRPRRGRDCARRRASPRRPRRAAAPLVNFNGVSSRDSAETNFGLQFEPPDQGLCVGNGFVRGAGQLRLHRLRRSGHALAGPFNVNGPFDEGLTRIHERPALLLRRGRPHLARDHPRASARPKKARASTSRSTPRAIPARVWTAYKLDTTDPARGKGKECPCFGDQPKLGIDAFNLYVTTDEFSILGPAFNGDQIYAFALKDLVAGAKPACTSRTSRG